MIDPGDERDRHDHFGPAPGMRYLSCVGTIAIGELPDAGCDGTPLRMTVTPPVAPIVAPIILTATMGASDFAWADGLRRAHFPPERNFIPAHITLFHHLPPARLPELARLLGDLTRSVMAPAARLSDVMFLGRGVAYRVDSPSLLDVRTYVAEWFAADLTPQDRQSPRFHITVQNKVAPETARGLHASLSRDFRPRPLVIDGLAAWYYLGGPWQLIRRFNFLQRRA